MLNKKAVIIASSLAAIPLTAMLIAAAIHRGRIKSPKTSGFLEQKRSRMSVITNVPYSQQQKEKSQAQLQSPWQGSDTKK